MSSMNKPAALTMGARHGVETLWCRKAAASRASSARLASSRWVACQAARSGVPLMSLSLCDGACGDAAGFIAAILAPAAAP